MQHRLVVRAFIALWWIVGLLLVWYSLRTVSGTFDDPARPHIAILAALEAAAAILFLIPRTMRIGGASLLVIFAIAFVLHAVHREFASQLILYAAAVAFVVVHGVPVAPSKIPSRA
jgi:hypothetical protein